VRSAHRKVCIHISCVGAVPSDFVLFPCSHLCICRGNLWHACYQRAPTSRRHVIVVPRDFAWCKGCALARLHVHICRIADVMTVHLLSPACVSPRWFARSKTSESAIMHAILLSQRCAECMWDTHRKGARAFVVEGLAV
jgi:hypothetical protein